MTRIAFVTASEPNCGIHYYAEEVCDVLSRSTKHDFYMLECDSEAEFHSKCDADIAIINYHPWVLSWYNPVVSANIKQIQFLIQDHTPVSENIYHLTPWVREVISMDVTCESTEHFHAGIRPVIFHDDITYQPAGQRLRIGTSGVGQHNKHVDHMIALLNQQFDEPVDFNIHFSVGHFTPLKQQQLQQLVDACSQQAKPNINVNLVCERFTGRQLTQWLNQNDINIYMYDNFDSNAVSASIDKALAARKPIGVNNSNFFRHIYSSDTSLLETPIKHIVQAGITPLQKYHDQWNQHALLQQYENLIDRYV